LLLLTDEAIYHNISMKRLGYPTPFMYNSAAENHAAVSHEAPPAACRATGFLQITHRLPRQEVAFASGIGCVEKAVENHNIFCHI